MDVLVTQQHLDALIDGVAVVREHFVEIERRCGAEDASLELALYGVDQLIADVWAGAIVGDSRRVTETPRLARLRDQGLRQADAAQQALIGEAYAGITENLDDAVDLVGSGLRVMWEEYQAGRCLRDNARITPELEVMFDRFEQLAERARTLQTVAGVLPWALGAGLVAVVAWLVFGKKR